MNNNIQGSVRYNTTTTTATNNNSHIDEHNSNSYNAYITNCNIRKKHFKRKRRNIIIAIMSALFLILTIINVVRILLNNNDHNNTSKDSSSSLSTPSAMNVDETSSSNYSTASKNSLSSLSSQCTWIGDQRHCYSLHHGSVDGVVSNSNTVTRDAATYTTCEYSILSYPCQSCILCNNDIPTKEAHEEWEPRMNLDCTNVLGVFNGNISCENDVFWSQWKEIDEDDKTVDEISAAGQSIEEEESKGEENGFTITSTPTIAPVLTNSLISSSLPTGAEEIKDEQELLSSEHTFTDDYNTTTPITITTIMLNNSTIVAHNDSIVNSNNSLDINETLSEMTPSQENNEKNEGSFNVSIQENNINNNNSDDSELASVDEPCRAHSDCLNKSCGKQAKSISLLASLGDSVCCPSNETKYFNGDNYCTMMPNRSECYFDEMCVSNICINEICEKEQQSIGEACETNKHCSNGECGISTQFSSRLDFLKPATSICCPSNQTVEYSTERYCTSMQLGAKCFLDDMCQVGNVCSVILRKCSVPSILYNLTNQQQNYNETPSLQDDGTDCRNNDQCASKACGKINSSLTAKAVCCESGETISDNIFTYCTGLDVGVVCKSDAMCLSNVCIQGVCAEGLRERGEMCEIDSHCINAVNNSSNDEVCGLQTASLNSEQICCPSGETTRYGDKSYCTKMIIGSRCQTDDMCAFELKCGTLKTCVENTTIVSQLTEQLLLDVNEDCFLDLQCRNGICAKESGSLSSGSICCPSGMAVSLNGTAAAGAVPSSSTLGGEKEVVSEEDGGIMGSATKGVLSLFSYCTEMPAGYPCVSDDMCASNICVTADEDGSGLLNGNTRVCKEGPQAVNQACNINSHCQNNICALQSGGFRAPKVCCQSGKSIDGIDGDSENNAGIIGEGDGNSKPLKQYCSDLTEGTKCVNDFLCASGKCRLRSCTATKDNNNKIFGEGGNDGKILGGILGGNSDGNSGILEGILGGNGGGIRGGDRFADIKDLIGDGSGGGRD